MSTINEYACPLCGENNACGAHDKKPCWCCSTDIPQGLRDLIPAAQKMKACICQKCVTKFQQSQQQQ